MANIHVTASLAVLLSLAATAVPAQAPALQFSAETVQATPEQQPHIAHMYVGHERVRMEYIKDRQAVAEIIDWGRGKVILLLQQQQTYIESTAAVKERNIQRQAGEDSNPCLGSDQLQCQKLGQQIVSGIAADKWAMTLQRDGQTEHSLHWIDPQRQMPLREFRADGSITQLSLQGQQFINGRHVERWERITVQADGKTQRAWQWYDPELSIAIREELADGSYRELRNIKVAAQPDELFVIPAGYRRVEVPTQTGGAAVDSLVMPSSQ